MRADNDLIQGVTIDHYADPQDGNEEIDSEFPADGRLEQSETPDVVRDQEDPDQWGSETGVTE